MLSANATFFLWQIASSKHDDDVGKQALITIAKLLPLLVVCCVSESLQ